MPSADFDQLQSEMSQDHLPIQCDACQSAFESDSQQATSFVLLDQLTIPLISCDTHLEEFTSICGLTTDDTAELLHHLPAGGIRCPSCQLAPYNTAQPMMSIQDGAVAFIACPDHQSEIVDRFYTGLQTQHQLTDTLGTKTSPPR